MDTLERNNYFILKEKHMNNAVPIKYNGNIVYLHKNVRGWHKDSFSHREMSSLVRVVMFRFFGFRCKNIKDLMNTFTELDIYYDYDDEGNIVINPTFSHANIIETTSVDIFGRPNIVRFENYKYDDFNVLDFCDYFNRQFETNITSLLNDIILSIHKQLYVYYYTLYKISKNEEVFKKCISPTIYDYMMTKKILNYIANVK